MAIKNVWKDEHWTYWLCTAKLSWFSGRTHHMFSVYAVAYSIAPSFSQHLVDNFSCKLLLDCFFSLSLVDFNKNYRMASLDKIFASKMLFILHAVLFCLFDILWYFLQYSAAMWRCSCGSVACSYLILTYLVHVTWQSPFRRGRKQFFVQMLLKEKVVCCSHRLHLWSMFRVVFWFCISTSLWKRFMHNRFFEKDNSLES